MWFVVMEPASDELCELSKLDALLDWVGISDVIVLTIRKEWFLLFGATSVIVRLPARPIQSCGCQAAS